jgi:hypothetical protein
MMGLSQIKDSKNPRNFCDEGKTPRVLLRPAAVLPPAESLTAREESKSPV